MSKEKLNEVPRCESIDPPHMHDKTPNKKILKLGKKITDVAPHKLFGCHVEDAEYWGLAEILTEEMVDVALTMELRHHYTFDQLAKMNPKYAEPKENLQRILDEMAEVGLIEFDYGYHYDHNGRTAPQSERRYILPMFVPGSAELFNMDEIEPCNNKRLKEHPALASFFERMTYVPLAGLTQMIPEGGAGVGMHVIPVEKAIEMENASMDIEHLSYWLKKYEGHIGVGQCSCRASRQALGEGCGDDNFGWCIGVGDFADYCRETGKGHDITYDEAMAILKKADEMGYVHQITNIDGENKIFGICNCNVNICNALRTSQLFNTPNLSRSAYTAKVEPKNCVACGLCVESCPAGAVKLGQKLCTKQGEVVYPRHKLPDNHKWSRKEWDPDYRDNNRKNCYDSGTAPCKATCPAHIAIQGYIKMAAQGRYQDALALIKRNNPFPSVCGHVCSKGCESACTRGAIDQAVSIDAVKKFIAAQDLNAETRYVPKVNMPVSPGRLIPKDHFDEKIAIIGAGPAGLSAAYYLATMGYKPTVFEKNKRPGGMMVYGIPNFKLEKDVVDAEIDVIRQLGVEIKCGVEVGKDITLDELRKEGYKAFYVAIGCQGGRKLGVPGEDAAGVEIAVDFLKNAIDDNTRKLTGDTVVIGGGNVAVDCARTAKRFGSENVNLFCLEDKASMLTTEESNEEMDDEGIVVNNSWGPKEILKDEAGNVTGVVFKKCLRTIDPETKRFSPLYDENVTTTINCKNVVVAIGQSIEWGKLLEGSKVEFWRGNYPVADQLTYQTKQEDIFVGGDVYTGPKFVIHAIAAGKEAAISIHRFVQPGTSMTIGRNRNDFIKFDRDNIVVDEYDKTPRQEAVRRPGEYKMSFNDFSGTLTEEQIKKETSRCLSCGASVVDPNKCIGCGVCTTRCEFDAIHLHRDHPKASTMRVAEDKFKYILPNQGKRMMKILFHSKTKEEKEHNKAYNDYQKRVKKAQK